MEQKYLFFVQVAVSATAMAFSITMLTLQRDPAVYLPILTGIVGFWTPNPKLKRPESDAQVHPATTETA